MRINFFTTGDPAPAIKFSLEPGMVPPAADPATVVVPSSLFLESFAHLPKLRQLKLDSLGISGGFPASWQQQMVNLTKLDLSNNMMQGPIPWFFNEFTSLKTLLLDRNEFGGPIPSFESLKFLSG
ncbi:hypothetical protein BGX28_002998 [Mortierella sp. GBA30]|nr:hypothetical protein BGX28_002998 [Mortierella sp. GBA30]